MVSFRILLAAMIAVIVLYTGAVGLAHGWGLFPIFFGDILALTWPGQFNVDFSCFLLFSGLWLAWRNHFSIGGVALGLLGVVGGTMLLAPYLLFASIQAKGDMKIVLLGRTRAAIQVPPEKPVV
jgi:hypothetical protein